MDEQTYLKYLSDQNNAAQIPVSMGLANEDGFTHTGVISSFDNNLNTTSGTIRVRATFDNPNGTLLPGLYSRIRLGGGQPRSAILISPTAIGVDQDKRFVVVVNTKNQTSYREVKLGAIQDGLQIIESGLKVVNVLLSMVYSEFVQVIQLHHIMSACHIAKFLTFSNNLSQLKIHLIRQKVNQL